MKKYLRPILSLIGLLVLIEVLETVLDYLFGDNDGQISNFYARVLISIVEIFIVLTVVIAFIKALVELRVLRQTKRSYWILSSIILILTFVLAEVYISRTTEEVNLSQLTGKELIDNPMSKWAHGKAYCAYAPISNGIYENKKVNNFGFISPDIEKEKPDSIIRIVFLGGSSTAGHGLLTLEDTWPHLTQNLLKKQLSNARIEYINAAVGGYSTFESYGRLWSLIRFLNPDILVVNHGWNDMYYFPLERNIINWRNSVGNWSINNKVQLKIYAPLFVDRLISWSQLLSHLRLKLTKSVAEGELKNEDLNKELELRNSFNYEALNVFEDNLGLIHNLAKMSGTKLFICKQPTLISTHLNDSLRYKCKVQNHGFDYETHLEAFDSIYSVIDRCFLGNQIIDLTSMNGNVLFFNDHIHPNEAGSVRYAEIVSNDLTSYIKNNLKLN